MSIWEMNLSAGAMILLTLALRPMARRRLPPGALPLLWIPAALRLALPWELASPLSLANLLSPALSPPDAAPCSLTALSPWEAQPSPAAGLSPGSWPWALVWAAGAALWLGWFAAGYLRWARRLRSASPCQGYPARWAQSCGRRGLRVVCCPWAKGPFAAGVLCPRIVLPQGWESLSPQELNCILNHELAHIRRLDPLWKLLARVLVSVHWCNPLVWAGYRWFCRDLELACDSAALRGWDSRRRAAYALCLIRLAGEEPWVPGASFSRNPIEERIVSIMTNKRPSRLVLVLTAAVVAAAGLALGTSAQSPVLPAAGSDAALRVSDTETALTLSSPVDESCWVSLAYGPVTEDYFHDHVDLAPAEGSPTTVTAAASGTVLVAGTDEDESLGLRVVLDHGDGAVTFYNHLESVQVKEGDTVAAGDVLGQMGRTGAATGVHLGFGLLVDGEAENPMDYVR